MDLARDQEYDRGLEYRNNPRVWDEDAMARSQNWEKALASGQPDKMMNTMQMTRTKGQVNERLKEKMNKEFIEYRDLRAKNMELRDKIAFNFKSTRELFQNVEKDRLDLINMTRDRIQKEIGRNLEKQELTLLDELNNSERDLLRAKAAEKAAILQSSQDRFDPHSEHQSAYEKELYLISRLALLGEKKDIESWLYKYEYVFDCMKNN